MRCDQVKWQLASELSLRLLAVKKEKKTQRGNDIQRASQRRWLITTSTVSNLISALCCTCPLVLGNKCTTRQTGSDDDRRHFSSLFVFSLEVDALLKPASPSYANTLHCTWEQYRQTGEQNSSSMYHDSIVIVSVPRCKCATIFLNNVHNVQLVWQWNTCAMHLKPKGNKLQLLILTHKILDFWTSKLLEFKTQEDAQFVFLYFKNVFKTMKKV